MLFRVQGQLKIHYTLACALEIFLQKIKSFVACKVPKIHTRIKTPWHGQKVILLENVMLYSLQSLQSQHNSSKAPAC